jgi:DNA-directed RNA polymerase alpha subunit
MLIKELDISNRAFNALNAAGIKSLSQLQAMDRRTIAHIRGIGKQTYNEILDMLDNHQAGASSPVTRNE